MMVHSFISSQKFTVQQTLERKFSRYLTLPQVSLIVRGWG